MLTTTLNVNQLSLLSLKSELLLVVAYAIVGVLIRKPVFLMAFLSCYLTVNSQIMQGVSEYQVYLIDIVIYSYVFSYCKTAPSKFSCVTIMILALVLSFDALLYGQDGIYGTSETFVYRNIESIALLAHLFFISTLVSYKGILNSIRSLIDSISSRALNSDYFMVYWYNAHTVHKK